MGMERRREANGVGTGSTDQAIFQKSRHAGVLLSSLLLINETLDIFNELRWPKIFQPLTVSTVKLKSFLLFCLNNFNTVYLLWSVTRLTFCLHFISFYSIILLYLNVSIQPLAAIRNKPSVDWCLIACWQPTATWRVLSSETKSSVSKPTMMYFVTLHLAMMLLLLILQPAYVTNWNRTSMNLFRGHTHLMCRARPSITGHCSLSVR